MKAGKPEGKLAPRELAVSLLILAILGLILTSSIFTASFSTTPSPHFMGRGGSAYNNSTRPVYTWFFGYVGDTFYPQSELGILPQTMIQTAKSLSQTFGKDQLNLLTAVDEIPLKGGTIEPSMIPTIRSYVSTLEQSGAVYGRLDMIQFNLTATRFGDCTSWSDCPIYNQSALYLNTLGLKGIWFDHVARYYATVGNVTFNQMMQNLTELYPSATFILNHDPTQFGYITELPGYSWGNQTYVSPSPPSNSLVPN